MLFPVSGFTHAAATGLASARKKWRNGAMPGIIEAYFFFT